MTLHRSQLPQYEFTASGYQALLDEQAALLKSRPLAVEDLAKAREMGDLSENGYYKASRAKLSSIDSRLRRLSVLLKYGKIIEKTATDMAQFGSTVVITDGNKERVFELVGALESDPVKGKLSVVSPIGKALVGKKVGDEVLVETPSGTMKFQITSIR